MKRAYYSDTIKNFLDQENNYILGELVTNNQFSLEELQRNTWIEQINILKRELCDFQEGHMIFEYTIPRIGNRIDNVIILKSLIFLVEFKIGEEHYPKHALDQVTDYALDLKNFHEYSHDRILIPILVATKAENKDNALSLMKDGIYDVLRCNDKNLKSAIELGINNCYGKKLNAEEWINSLYMPTPTIIEAAQALYRKHDVKEISRNDASAINLNRTTEAINNIVKYSKDNNKKSICFITGVPGAGKTLAGLNIANERHKFDEKEHAVFLSGNQPLVDVLQEALARDDSARTGKRKTIALRESKSFIQIIHHFRDEAISNKSAPNEKVTIFDEAQRAWDEDKLNDFMTRKKGVFNFNMSEPEFLISFMDRHEDWAVIVCLVGGGQEINTGEAGICEWFCALKKRYSNWNVYVSDRITDTEYTKGMSINSLFEGMNCNIIKELHLSVSLRSFRSEKVSDFIKALLDVNKKEAKKLYKELKDNYPIFLTRNLLEAKKWVRTQAKGSERIGLTASSGAKRLRAFGIWVQSKIDAPNWFLNSSSDVRSSYFLEDTATEFDIQGLELDWTIVCWDADFRFVDDHFDFYSFKGTKWLRVNKSENKVYLKNAYRVLLTRARQGFIIFIPKGDEEDLTRKHSYYDGIYEYLRDLGIEEY